MNFLDKLTKNQSLKKCFGRVGCKWGLGGGGGGGEVGAAERDK